jgi:hypothetical protein
VAAPLSFANDSESYSSASSDRNNYEFDSSWTQGDFNINTGTGSVGGGGLPTWLMIAAGAGLLWYLLKKKG